MKTFTTLVIDQFRGKLLNSYETNKLECHTPWGQVGILARHIPWISLMEPGPLLVHTSQGLREFIVRKGVIRVHRSGHVDCLLQEYLDVENAQSLNYHEKIGELEKLMPFLEEQAKELERDLSWYRLCAQTLDHMDNRRKEGTP